MTLTRGYEFTQFIEQKARWKQKNEAALYFTDNQAYLFTKRNKKIRLKTHVVKHKLTLAEKI